MVDLWLGDLQYNEIKVLPLICSGNVAGTSSKDCWSRNLKANQSLCCLQTVHPWSTFMSFGKAFITSQIIVKISHRELRVGLFVIGRALSEIFHHIEERIEALPKGIMSNHIGAIT